MAYLFSKVFSLLLGRWRGALAAGIGITLFTLLKTFRNGWIELTTDGEQMWVEVER